MKLLAKFLLPAGLLFFLLSNAVADISSVRELFADFQLTPFLIAFSLLLIDYPQGAEGWHILLGRMGIKMKFKDSLRIWILSTTARYIPGSIWQYVGRIELGRKAGIARKDIITSMLAEVFFVLVAGVTMASLSLLFVDLKDLGVGIWIFFLPFVFFILHPAISKRIIRLLAKLTNRVDMDLDNELGLGDSLYVLPFYVVNFLINGTALYFLVLALGIELQVSQIAAFTGFYAASWVLGYIAVFAPAGVGVTEITLAGLLSLSMPFSVASAVALSYRFFLTIAEVTVFLLVLNFDGKHTKPVGEAQ